MLCTAEGMLQHCREALQPVLQQETHAATLGWDCPSAVSSYDTEAGKETGRQRQADPGTETARQEMQEHLPRNSTKAHLG